MDYTDNTKIKYWSFQVSRKPQIICLQIIHWKYLRSDAWPEFARLSTLVSIWVITYILPYCPSSILHWVSQPHLQGAHPTLPLPPSSPPCSRAGPERSMGDLNVRNHIVGVLLIRGHVTHHRPRCACFTLVTHYGVQTQNRTQVSKWFLLLSSSIQNYLNNPSES